LVLAHIFLLVLNLGLNLSRALVLLSGRNHNARTPAAGLEIVGGDQTIPEDPLESLVRGRGSRKNGLDLLNLVELPLASHFG
jgi:hypothetical protein